MPHPREAIYDVMKAQQQRVQDEQRLAAAFEAWNAKNRAAGNSSPVRGTK